MNTFQRFRYVWAKPFSFDTEVYWFLVAAITCFILNLFISNCLNDLQRLYANPRVFLIPLKSGITFLFICWFEFLFGLVNFQEPQGNPEYLQAQLSQKLLILSYSLNVTWGSPFWNKIWSLGPTVLYLLILHASVVYKFLLLSL